MDSQVVVFDQFQPSSLSHIKISLSEDVLQAFMAGVDFTAITNEVMAPDLQSMHCGSQF